MAAIVRLRVYRILLSGRCSCAHGSPRCQISCWIVGSPFAQNYDHSLIASSPVLIRSVMGMYGSYFFIFIRAVICIIWYGIQTFYAGNILSVMLRCIFGSSWQSFDNTLSASANVTSKQLLTFFMAWLMEFPFVGTQPKTPFNMLGSLMIRRCGCIPGISTTCSQSRVSLCLWPPLHCLAGVWPMAVD